MTALLMKQVCFYPPQVVKTAEHKLHDYSELQLRRMDVPRSLERTKTKLLPAILYCSSTLRDVAHRGIYIVHHTVLQHCIYPGKVCRIMLQLPYGPHGVYIVKEKKEWKS